MSTRRLGRSGADRLIECSDCGRLFRPEDYPLHECDGSMILDPDYPGHGRGKGHRTSAADGAPDTVAGVASKKRDA